MASKGLVRAKPKIDGLGSALTTAFEVAPDIEGKVNGTSGDPNLVDIAHLSEDPENARKRFDEDALKELADTIREHGVLEPLIVVRLAKDNYQIRSGARRFRAAGIAGVKQVPVWISKDFSSLAAVVVNLQRENLHPIEIGNSLADIAKKEGISSQQMAAAVGRSKTWVSRYLSMSRLPAEDKEFLRDLETADATLLSDVAKLLKTQRKAVLALAEGGTLDRSSVSALLAAAETRKSKSPAKAKSLSAQQESPTALARAGSAATKPNLVIEHDGAEWYLDPAQESGNGRYQVTSGSDSTVQVEVKMPVKVIRIDL